MTRLLYWIFTITVIAATLVSAGNIISTTAPDFTVYYGGAKYLLAGRLLYRDTDLFTGVGYPPQSLLLFIPFAWLPYQSAQAIWIIFSLAALVVSIYLAGKLFLPEFNYLTFGLLFAATAITFPVKFTLGMGQSNLLSLLLVIWGIWFYHHKRLDKTAIFLAAAMIIKPHLLILIPAIWLSGQKRIATHIVIINVLVALTTGMIFGWQNLRDYFSHAIPYLSVFRGREIYYNQGARAIISRFLDPLVAPSMIMLISGLILALSLWKIYRSKLDLTRAILLMLPTMLLVEPLSWQHHYVFLIPVFIYLLSLNLNRIRLAVLCPAYILISVNLDLAGNQDRSWMSALILSHVGLGNIMIYYLLTIYFSSSWKISRLRSR